MSAHRASRPLACLALAGAMFGASCGGPGDLDSRMPAVVPDGFPVPADFTLVATSGDPNAHLTVVEMDTALGMTDAVRFFSVGLVSGGYVIDRSVADGRGWEMEFSRGDFGGSIRFTAGQGSATRVVLSVNRA